MKTISGLVVTLIGNRIVDLGNQYFFHVVSKFTGGLS